LEEKIPPFSEIYALNDAAIDSMLAHIPTAGNQRFIDTK
jgi:hypothetical protein